MTRVNFYFLHNFFRMTTHILNIAHFKFRNFFGKLQLENHIPKHIQVWDEVHEPLRVDGHQVNDLADGAVLLGGAVHAKRLPVYGRDQRSPQVHPHNEHLLKVLRQQDALSLESKHTVL